MVPDEMSTSAVKCIKLFIAPAYRVCDKSPICFLVMFYKNIILLSTSRNLSLRASSSLFVAYSRPEFRSFRRNESST